jgi:putative membrane protein
MAAHLLLGMLAPLLLVPAAPVTLLLRVLPVMHARRVSALLRSWPFRAGSSPAGAAVLNVGGLWLFYTSGLYPLSSASSMVHVLVQVHFLVAGYLLVAALIGPDPQPHRPAFRVRAAVLVLSVAAHDILAKCLYAHPPAGVAPGQGAAGALLMYYGGGALEILLMVLLCHRWYVAGAPNVVGDRSGRILRRGHRAYPGHAARRSA